MNAESSNKDTKIESKTITEVQSESIIPSGRYGPLVSRIPVIISQSKVYISINSEICFDHTVIDIRDCTRNVFITQCSLLDMGDKKHGKVHLNGYINESIEYTTPHAQRDNNPNCTELYFKNLKIPFEFAAKIDYCTRPVLLTPNRFITVTLPAMPNLTMSKEKLLCQLDEAEICEADIIRKNICPKDNNNTLTEYMVASITFTILQWQQVTIPRSLPYNTP